MRLTHTHRLLPFLVLFALFAQVPTRAADFKREVVYQISTDRFFDGSSANNNPAQSVGSFKSWNQSQLLYAREGDDWVCRIDLEPGRYTYKFIVDGNWLPDPANPDTEEDEAGNVNNVLVVGNK